LIQNIYGLIWIVDEDVAVDFGSGRFFSSLEEVSLMYQNRKCSTSKSFDTDIVNRLRRSRARDVLLTRQFASEEQIGK